MASSPGKWTWVAVGVYIALMAAVLVRTLHIASPKYHGYDWFLAGILAYPGVGIVVFFPSLSNLAAVTIGIVVNAMTIYGLGALFTGTSRRFQKTTL